MATAVLTQLPHSLIPQAYYRTNVEYIYPSNRSMYTQRYTHIAQGTNTLENGHLIDPSLPDDVQC